ncbi:hypothetical protein [Bacillus sp. FJAT-49736]|uniref:hypothetical protein n=1 Tax=Bacillus sp. FJAT-49736 TaxID=2833582 RepID=UPI001BC9720B|nr:hypothetical protein [Bacillus sp. FJAT-49736]MBS4174389.1 hypothetical protein [Bacillus sp. FJAT-49736]
MSKKTIMIIAALVLGISTASFSATAQVSSNQPKIQVTNKVVQKSSMEEQLEMLEKGVVPTTPALSANTWAKAVKDRNGALQYALFTDKKKAASKKSLERSHWVTGVSSPWVESYRVSQIEKKDKSIDYKVEFDLYTSAGKVGIDEAILHLLKKDNQWYINGIFPGSSKTIGIWNTNESIKDVDIPKVETFQSKLGYKLQLPKDMIDKLVIQDSTCKNEEGNPPCTFFAYKDKHLKKEVNIITLIRLSEKQERSSYYTEHPFLKKITKSKNVGFYYMIGSEHPYAKNMNSKEAKEWDYLLNELKGKIKYIKPGDSF